VLGIVPLLMVSPPHHSNRARLSSRGGDCVQGVEGMDEVVCIWFVIIFDKEVIDDKREDDFACMMVAA
jgi:hypothetical protein